MKKYNLITASLLALGLTACGAQNTSTTNESTSAKVTSAPGAPGVEPFWAYAGKTGIGTSFEEYKNGQYSDTAATAEE